jgi:hypothetical protein
MAQELGKKMAEEDYMQQRKEKMLRFVTMHVDKKIMLKLF